MRQPHEEGFLAPPEAVKTRGHQWLALGQGVRNLKSACEESGDFSGKRSETYRGSEIRPRNPTPESELKARPPGQPPGAVRQWTRGPPWKLHQTQIPGPSSPPRPRNRSLRSAQISISSRSTTHSREIPEIIGNYIGISTKIQGGNRGDSEPPGKGDKSRNTIPPPGPSLFPPDYSWFRHVFRGRNLFSNEMSPEHSHFCIKKVANGNPGLFTCELDRKRREG